MGSLQGPKDKERRCYFDIQSSPVTVVAEPDGAVAVTVVDDGVGPGPGHRSGGLGLVNIARRAETLGGSVEIGAATDGHGTRLAWLIPGST